MNDYTAIPENMEQFRIPHPITHEKGDKLAGFFKIKLRGAKHEPLIAFVCYAADLGWEHASVSLNRKRTPTWEEMCQIKEMFWGADKTVCQYHPAKNNYVNFYPYCLHLWRSVTHDIQPPVIMV